MRLNAAVFYYPAKKTLPWKRSSTVWVSLLAWGVDAHGHFTEVGSTDGIDVTLYKKGSPNIPIRTYSGLLPGSDRFYNTTVGVPWSDGDSEYLNSVLTVEVSGAYGKFTPTVLRAPYDVGPGTRVFMEAAKIGVLVMTDSVNQPMDTILNQIYDSVRRGIAVVPGEPNSFYASTNPASGVSWGTATSFGFEAVGVMITNLSDEYIEYSLDGTNTHGRIPPQTIKVYDFRRASQVYFRATSTAPTVEVEAW